MRYVITWQNLLQKNVGYVVGSRINDDLIATLLMKLERLHVPYILLRLWRVQFLTYRQSSCYSIFLFSTKIFHPPPLFSNGVSKRGSDKLSLRELFVYSLDPRSRFLQIFLSSKVYNSLSRDDRHTHAYVKIWINKSIEDETMEALVEFS